MFSDFQFRFCIFFSGRTIVFKLRWVLMSIPSSLFVIEDYRMKFMKEYFVNLRQVLDFLKFVI